MDELVKLLNPTEQHQSNQKIEIDTINQGSDDQEILDRLLEHGKLLQNQFDSIDSKLTESNISIQKLMRESQEEISQLQPKSELIHEQFMKYEDDYIDYYESVLKPTPKPSNGEEVEEQKKNKDRLLIESLNEQIEWLKELERLKIWLTVLLEFRDRTDTLIGTVNSQSSPITFNEFDTVTNQLFDLIQSYHELRIQLSPQIDHFNLFEYIHQILRQSLTSLIETIYGIVAQTLENEIDWPQPCRASLEFQTPSTKRILETFKIAVNFQNKLQSRPDLVWLSNERRSGEDQEDRRVIWIPVLVPGSSILLQAILKPIILRFRFHFDGNRDTNRLDKPEWYFNHVLDRLDEHEKFIKSDVQKLFELSGQGSIKVFEGFMTQLINLIEKKLVRTVPGILEMKPILAHTIEKSIGFDQQIKQMNPANKTQWNGTVDKILSNSNWFNIWFEAEKKFVDDMYLEILSSRDTWEIEEEDPRPLELGILATKSSLRIQELTEQIKTKYEYLPRLRYQSAFLIKIQMVVLDSYSQRISGVLDGFERNNRLINVVGGTTDSRNRSKMNAGMNGLQRLVKVFISSHWILTCFRSWNDDDLFYADLYDQLKTEKNLPTEVDQLLKSIDQQAVLDPSVFTPLMARYEELLKRAEAAIVRHVVNEISVELKPYFSKRWDMTEDQSSEIEDLSSEIIPAISLWKSIINYLKEHIRPTIKFNKIIKPICQDLELKLLQKIIFEEPFSIRSITLTGAKQFEFDLHYGWLNFTSSLSNDRDKSLRLDKHFSKVLDISKLLSVPSVSSSPSTTTMRTTNHGDLTFEELVRICFDDQRKDDQFKTHLNDHYQLSIHSSLSRIEAQSALKRRPECWKS
ncbi:hypothetical protein MJO29_005751 [Puccinia striiformis f. sp. tritici]|uniref:Uncharacterized protein n=1 Tax=Puccinia striiformis f. sp. tritici PST-78 TaxID=1165861 RepID=A0A0L0V797_9BASI|nr:hypothetical protein Pst134EA_009843 [Puccinia striiformis f. sp. tritici]KAH9469321.1 hypothetical protein Pst134EA_009843 [Puccinia striiformis f. sp. tritici]KAI7960683.1 hypothetical protein MJO29_005751 [Puccinia striiformis f. sp. tritici]KNE95185.1 hypothetical protein PSTG_11451 [Puccinia striiformis f. sp. tritici PST-78]